MTEVCPFLSIITLDIRKLNSDVKKKLTEKILQNKHAAHKRMALDTKVQTDWKAVKKNLFKYNQE